MAAVSSDRELRTIGTPAGASEDGSFMRMGSVTGTVFPAVFISRFLPPASDQRRWWRTRSALGFVRREALPPLEWR